MCISLFKLFEEVDVELAKVLYKFVLDNAQMFSPEVLQAAFKLCNEVAKCELKEKVRQKEVKAA